MSTGPLPDPEVSVAGLEEGQPRAVDPLAMDALFDIAMPPPISLRDRFGVPPFSILDRRGGQWQERKRAWLTLGIRSELGRDARVLDIPLTGSVPYSVAARKLAETGETFADRGDQRPGRKADTSKAAAPAPGGGGFWLGKTADGRTAPGDPAKYGRASEKGLLYQSATVRDPDYYRKKSAAEAACGHPLTLEEFEAEYFVDNTDAYASGTSIFDPVICELVYRWFAGTGQHILDPFAGGSVRGLAAAILGRHYTGIDLRQEQIAANEAQVNLLPDDAPAPRWITGDSAELPTMRLGLFDLIFSCPPYADLEVYSDDPRDLSTMRYPDFEAMHGRIIAAACERLRHDRFAAWVISDVRDKGTTGSPYYGLVADTIRAFEAAGLRLYNDAIILDNVGSGAMRAAKAFQQSRKLVRMHQHLLIFVKGDPKAAAVAAGGHL